MERSATVSSPNSARSRAPSMNIRRIQPPSWSWARDHLEIPTLGDAGGTGNAASVPAERIVAIEDLAGDGGSVQRTEGVDHDRQLVGLARPVQGGLECSGLRTVREAADVMRERALADPASRCVVSLDVVQHLIGIEVAVVVRQVDRLWVPVELARYERADHEVLRLERLMNGRRHVKATGARFEVVDVEGHRVDRSVPTDHVPRRVIEHVPAHVVGTLEPDLRRALAALLERIGSV